jgi:hypothetical protein
MTTLSISALAREVYEAFEPEPRTRTNGQTFWTFKDDSPQWIIDLCHEAHAEMFPDDVRYEFVRDAVYALSNADDPDEVSLEASIYISDLSAWLGSRADRYSYCDEAVEEFGWTFTNTIELLQLGQAREKQEVLDLVRSFLETRVAELEESEDDSADES